jgi:hypothetical protein
MYYSAARHLPGAAGQRQYFALIVLAIVLIASAFQAAEPGPNPDYRPPSHTR